MRQTATRARARLWGLPALAWLPLAALFVVSTYRALVGQVFADDQPTHMINVAIIIHRLGSGDLIGAAKVLGLVEDPPLRYLLAMPGEALFPHTVWGPRIGGLVVSLIATWALIQLGRDIGGDLVGWVTGLLLVSSGVYTTIVTTFGSSMIVLGLAQAARQLCGGPLDLSRSEDVRRFNRAQLWIGLAFLTSTATLPFAVMALLIAAWENLPQRPRATLRGVAPTVAGYSLYHLLFFVLVPLLGSTVYGKAHRFGQYGHLFSRNGGAAIGYDSFLVDLRALNGQFLPFVSWALLVAALAQLWRRDRRLLVWVLPYLLVWGFYFGTGTDGYFWLGFVLLLPFGVAFVAEHLRWPVFLGGAAAVAAAVFAWSTVFFTVPYEPSAYPMGAMQAFYAVPVFRLNLVQPFPAIAHDLDRTLPPGAGYVDDINPSFAEFYANHDLANLGYGDPRRLGEIGTPAARLVPVAGRDCSRLRLTLPHVAVAITAKRLCPDQVASSISYPHSRIRLYVLRHSG